MKSSFIGWAYTSSHEEISKFAGERRISLLGISNEDVSDMLKAMSEYYVNVLIIDDHMELCPTVRDLIYRYCINHDISIVWYRKRGISICE